MYKTLAVIAVTLLSSTAYSDSFIKDSKRQFRTETGISINAVSSWDISGRNGSKIEVNSDTGWGFLLGYNFNEHFNFAFEYTDNSQRYEALIVPLDPSNPSNLAGTPFTINHKLTNEVLNFNFTYNILAKTLTPFVNGGLGWSLLDSNVRSSDINSACWWDPWWGYTCSQYYSTYSDTSFSYSIGGGVRWELTPNFVLKASINQRWLDIDTLGGTPEMQYGKLDFAWML